MQGNYDYDVRVLMCKNCGAPLKTGFTGGTVTCEYCGTVNVFTPRRDEPVEPAAAAVEMDEDQRIQLLRRQDGIQPQIPQELQPLLSGGQLVPWKEGEALAMWQATCRELANGSDYSSAELLYYLTIILSNHFSAKEDELRERALYESALEVLTLPRHRQLVRGLLARNAALAGDLDAAESWLAPCNPRSQDLESDSSWRVSRAEIETVRENWPGVLEVLGESIDQVPITATLDGKAIIQRANALERTGRVDEAASQLTLFLNANGSMGLDAMRSILSVYSDAGMDMCPESRRKAEENFSRRSGRIASQMANPGGCFGQIFALVGLMMLVMGLIFTFVLRPGGEGPPLTAVLVPALVGIVFIVIGVRHIRAGGRAAELYRNGIDGKATVVSLEPTGWRINEVPQYLLTMNVRIPDKDPYTATSKITLGESEKVLFSTGREINVKVDPRDPENVSVTG